MGQQSNALKIETGFSDKDILEQVRRVQDSGFGEVVLVVQNARVIQLEVSVKMRKPQR